MKERNSLYSLGDFCLGSVERVRSYLNQIRCKNIHVAFGDYDRVLRKLADRFTGGKDLGEISVRFAENRPLPLCPASVELPPVAL